MKKLLLALLFLPSIAGAAFLSTNGSTVTMVSPNNNTTAIPTTVSNSTMTIQLPSGVLLKTDGSGATQPVSGTVTANVGTGTTQANITQLSSTTVDTNSGTKSGGTLRVVIATDQPALTAKLLVTPDSVALPANQSVNVSQINAVTPLMGNGGTGTGSQRVTIASDNTAFTVIAGSLGVVGIDGLIRGAGYGAQNSSVPVNAQGPAAVGATAVGNPLRDGGSAHTALPTAVTDGQMQDLMLDKFGRVVTINNCPRDLIAFSTVTLAATTVETVVISSGGANVFNDLLDAVFLNTSATASRITLRSVGGPLAGNIALEFYVPAGDTRGLASGHIWPQTTANANWTVQSSASVTDIRGYLLYCKNK